MQDLTPVTIQEHLDGTRVRWIEKVSDEQYAGRSAKELFQ